MCDFLAIGVRAAGAAILDAERGRARRGRHLTIWPASNPSLATVFPAGDRLFWVTCGGCSCDLCLAGGSAGHTEPSRAPEKYRRKGWSETKIARAVQSKFAERRHAGHGRRQETPRELLRDLLSGLCATGDGVRLFAHSYSGNQNDEMVIGHAGEPATVHELIDGGDLPPTVLIDVTCPAGPASGRPK